MFVMKGQSPFGSAPSECYSTPYNQKTCVKCELCLWAETSAPCSNCNAREGMDVHALFQGMEQANLTKFDILGFDACLMATYEVVARLGKHADYYLASEELEPGHG
jgi:hypothetical protein